MNQYRTVFFRPRLSLDWKIPILILVNTEKEIQVLISDLLPTSDSLGSFASYGVMMHGIEEIKKLRLWYILPTSIGPHFELENPLPIPSSPKIPDPISWLRKVALPSREVYI